MRVLLVFLGLVLLVGGAVAVYRFLDEDTRAFDDARRADADTSHNLDRGRPNPGNIVDEEGSPEHDGGRRAESSAQAPDGTVYWVRDKETGGLRMSSVRPAPREQPRAPRPCSVDLTLCNEGASGDTPLDIVGLASRHYDPKFEPFNETVMWTERPLARGESRAFGKKIPPYPTALFVTWRDAKGRWGHSGFDRAFASGKPGEHVTWTLDASNSELSATGPRHDSDPIRTLQLLALLAMVATGVWIFARRHRRKTRTTSSQRLQ